MEDKYSEFVGDLLRPIRHQLIKKQRKIDAQNQLHSKTEMILKMANELLCIPETKIIILVRRYFDYCFKTLENALSGLTSATVLKYPKGMDGKRRLLDLISKGNVIVAELSCELQFCPWNYMTYVFEYEYREDSEWFRLCFDENPNLKGFFALNSVPKKANNEKGQFVLHSLNYQAFATFLISSFCSRLLVWHIRTSKIHKPVCSRERNPFDIHREYSRSKQAIEVL